ncbi:MAG: aminotransferase class IV [Porphyromonas sp.]|nr:aminotransferase class IV [Porphyromonas sp.]
MTRERRFIETIRLVDGVPQLLPYHEQRIVRTLAEGGQRPPFVLSELVESIVADCTQGLEGVYKLRFEYDASAVYVPSCVPYKPREVRCLIPCPIDSLGAYRHKWADRSGLAVPSEVQAQLDADPTAELIFTYEGRLTDTRYSNIVLQDAEGHWLTPDTPLLRGVMRQSLLDSGRIREVPLNSEDLAHCQAFRLINAMLPFEI